MKFIKQIIIYYLAFFMIGCGSRPPVSVEEAREMETRVIYGESKKILKASMNVLQDMFYSIDEVNSDMGLLIATKASEGKQAEIRKEKSSVDETPLWKKILVGVFVVTIIGGLMILLGGNNNLAIGNLKLNGGSSCFVKTLSVKYVNSNVDGPFLSISK